MLAAVLFIKIEFNLNLYFTFVNIFSYLISIAHFSLFHVMLVLMLTITIDFLQLVLLVSLVYQHNV